MSNKRPAQYTRDDVINLYSNLVDVIIVVDIQYNLVST